MAGILTGLVISDQICSLPDCPNTATQYCRRCTRAYYCMKRHLRRDSDRHAPECVALIRAQPMTTADPSSKKENTADGGPLAGGLSVRIFGGTGNTMAAPNGKYHPFLFSRPGRKVKTLIQYAASEPTSQAGIKANFVSPGRLQVDRKEMLVKTKRLRQRWEQCRRRHSNLLRNCRYRGS